MVKSAENAVSSLVKPFNRKWQARELFGIFKKPVEESLRSVLPITGIVILLCFTVAAVPNNAMMAFITGSIMLILGMGLFTLGSEMSMVPLGEAVGKEITKSKKVPVIVVVSFLIGVIITVAEPDLQVLSNQVPGIPNPVLIWTVAIGVGIFLATAILRIIRHVDLSVLLAVFYAAVLIVSFFVPGDFLAVAFDSGGVTTGPITVPFIMALGVGLSAIRGEKGAAEDSFGLVALSSIGPILSVLILGCFYSPKEAVFGAPIGQNVETVKDLMVVFTRELPHYAGEVALSILPIVAVFAIFQLCFHRYQRRQRLRVCVGFAYTYVGLILFLAGVNVGFAPVGSLIGSGLADSPKKWLLVPIGMLIGYFIVKAEPAIQILDHQVQTVTDGLIPAKTMNRCLSIGVSVSVGLAMLRILTGLDIRWIILPGYVLALVMSRIVPKIFVGIAFDSGGVASGPMTSTFLLPLCIGACDTLGGNIMTDAFGAVALVALTPLIAIQIMGLSYRIKLARQEKLAPAPVMPADIDEIVEIEEW